MIDYIYIKNFRSILNQEFCLSNRFEIEFDGTNLRIEESPYYIENFYSENEYSVKAIIGQNGVGKSTILRYITEYLSFPIDNAVQNDFILIISNKEEQLLNIYLSGEFETTIEPRINTSLPLKINVVKFNNPQPLIPDGQSFLSLTKQFDQTEILFFSNIVDFSQEIDYGPKKSPITYNLSSNHLLKFSYTNGEIGRYKVNEIEKNIHLILNYRNNLLKSIKLPNKLRINLNQYEIQHEFSRHSPGIKLYNQELFKSLGQTILETNKIKLIDKGTRDHVYFWISINLIYQVFNYSEIEDYSKLIEIIQNFNNSTYHKEIISFFRSEIVKLSNKNRERKFEHEIDWSEYFDKYEKFTELILTLWEKEHSIVFENYSFEIELRSDTEEAIKQLINSYYHLVTENEFMYFTWRDMSSGELALLRLFANINFFGDITNSHPTDKVILLIDELDAFFHPHWQKIVFNNLNDFISSKFHGKNIQLIFTSHSPFIISDLKKSEIIFLQHKDSKVIELKHLEEFKQTFGANIHTLFVDSFFIQNGLIGDFAAKKINEVIRKLRSLSDLSIGEREIMRKTILQIGEPVIQSKLIQMYNDRFSMDIHERLENIEKRLNSND